MYKLSWRRKSRDLKCILNENNITTIFSKYYTKPIDNRNGVKQLDGTELCANGFYFKYHPNDTCVSDCLKTGILFEKFILSYVQQFIDTTKNILDIGSNIGVHSIIYSNYLTTGHVYAFEPQPVIFDILRQNLEINNCYNVTAYNYGASKEDSTFFMNAEYDTINNHGAFRICDKTDDIKGIYIQCKNIDKLNIPNIGYIKIDVEGHEFEVIQGLYNTLLVQRPVLLIEIHETSPTKQDVLATLNQIGYSCYIKLSHCDYLFFSKIPNI